MTNNLPTGRIACVLLALAVVPQSNADELRLIRYTNLWTSSPVRSPDPSGVTYVPELGRLLISDSEISEYGEQLDPGSGRTIFRGRNVFECSLDATRLHRQYFAAPPDSRQAEPVGIAYHPLDKHVYVVDDDQKRIFRYRFVEGARFENPVAAGRTGRDGAYTDPEGVAVDPRNGDLLVVSGTKEERVLRFRFHVGSNEFEFVSEFSVAAHISDPEGIAIHPENGHVFVVSGDGIAEFTGDGEFVQRFAFDFLNRTDARPRLPGGATFAPSSDPNDRQGQLSLYVTCRGLDNGRFPAENSLDGGLAEFELVRTPRPQRTLVVPEQHATIQQAVREAADGDLILVNPGVYYGGINLEGKRITLASRHYLDRNPAHLAGTVLDGEGGDFVLNIPASADDDPPVGEATGNSARTLIHGFTIRNADDGVTSTGVFDMEHCLVTGTTDGIDYEGGGGVVRYCRFERNRDDAIDLDGPTAVLIEHNRLVGNDDDGVEIRLQPYSDPKTLRIVLRDNWIADNGEDGIQLIGYDVPTNRTFHFQGNRIVRNAMSGIGFMSKQNTREDYEAAPLPEEVVISNCTFAENEYHLTGGGRVLLANNLFHSARQAGLKGVGGDSLITANLFWEAEWEAIPAQVLGSNFRLPPNFADESYFPSAGSPAVDRGLVEADWQGRRWRLADPEEFRGEAPDLGALER